MRWLGAVAMVGLAAGCGGDDGSLVGDSGYMPDDPPAGICMSESGPCDTEADDASSGPGADECASSTECDAGLACTATFDGDIGEFECRAACIDDLDEASWCIDDAGCCNATSVCSGRGYCMPNDASDTSVGDTTAADTTDGSTDDATSSGTSGDASTSSGDASTSTGDGT
jgi:hypothetical protein